MKIYSCIYCREAGCSRRNGLGTVQGSPVWGRVPSIISGVQNGRSEFRKVVEDFVGEEARG